MINSEIERLRGYLTGCFSSAMESDVVPDKDKVSQWIDSFYGKAKQRGERTLAQYYDEFLSEGRKLNRWSPSSLYIYELFRNHLDRIKEGLSFADLEKGGMELILDYCFKKRGQSNRSARNFMITLRTFLNWCKEKGYCGDVGILHEKARLKVIPREVVYLDNDELMRLFRHDLSNSHVKSLARDIFCFCAFTSLRISDARNLKKSDIFDKEIHLVTMKTSKPIVIELTRNAQSIIDRYIDDENKDGRLFPSLSSDYISKLIKSIGKDCKINTPITITRYKGSERFQETKPKYEFLSTHCARRTFICHALSVGIPVNIIMKWTGHSDYKSMLPYIDIFNTAKKNAMSLLDSDDTS